MSGPAGSGGPGGRDFRRSFYQALGPSERREGRTPDWIPDLHPAGRDPLPVVVEALRLAGSQSVQLVAGGRGTGRASGLRALAHLLRLDEAVVVSVDLQRLLPAHVPLARIEVQLAVVGGVDDALSQGVLQGALPGPDTWERAATLLPQGIGRSRPMARERVREALKGGLTGGMRLALMLAGGEDELRAALQQRYDELLQGIWRRRGREVHLVVLLAGLDRLGPGGPPMSPGGVAPVLLSGGSVVALPETHVVVVAPAVAWWLREELEVGLPMGRVHWWPAVPVVQDDGALDPERVTRLLELVGRRGDWRQVLPEAAHMEELVRASGGHLRELLDMMREAVLAWGPEATGPGVVARAVRNARAPLRTWMVASHHAALDHVARHGVLPHGDGLPTAEALELLDAGLLLGHAGPGMVPAFSVSPLVAGAGGVP